MSVTTNGAILRIPGWVNDLASFRRWLESGEFPEEGRLSHLNGDLWVDMSMETVVHNQVKSRFSITLGGLVDGGKLGRLFLDRMRLTHPEVGLSTESDLIFGTHETFQRQRLQLMKGDGSVELVGSPDMVLEVVSDSSEVKDTQVLPDLYWKAGVREYWLVDPRGKELSFDIYRRTTHGFTLTKKKDGWIRSQVFGKDFRLTRQETTIGVAEFTLEIR
jgi:Uma2 family endonuclease